MGFFDRLFRRAEPAAERSAWLDQEINRAAQSVRQTAQSGLRHAARGLEAGETPPWTASWATSTPGINADLARSLPTARARSRDLARNNEWAVRYRIHLNTNVLGASGIRLQMRLRKPTRAAAGEPASLDAAANAAFETAFEDWGKRGACEVSGQLSWREIESLMLWTLFVDGEILYRVRPGGGPYGIRIQVLDPSLLDVTLHRDYAGRRVRMGVEIDDDGAPVAYWLRMARAGDDASFDVASIGAHVRIPAEQIRHRFLAEEVGQLRGKPPLAVGARRLHMLDDFEDSAAVACANSAKRLGFFVSPTGDSPPGFADQIISSVLDAARAAGKVLSPEEIEQITASAEKYTTTVPGTFDTIPSGYDFRQYDSPWPNINAGDYVKSQVRGWSAAQGVSYVSIGNDLSDVNYSSARVGILDEREHYKEIQSRLISWLHAEVFAIVAPYLAAKTPGLRVSRLAEYLRAATWQPRRWQGIDPVKEADADGKNLQNGLTSRSRLILSRGEDPDEIAAEIAADEALFGPLPAPAAPAKEAPSAEDAPPAKGKPSAKFSA